MSTLKKPLSIPEQIDKIRKHNIAVDDAQATIILQQISYYRLSGYALQYRISTDSHLFRPCTTFDSIHMTYCLDADLRSLLLKYLERTEYYYKCLIGNEFAMLHCSNPPHDQHYDIRNYYDKAGISKTLTNFAREKNYYHDSRIVQHHIRKYQDKMPLWVMLELMTYSSMSMFYHALYPADKTMIASKIGISSRTLDNHLHCLSVLRNKCAHGARLYNTTLTPPVRFTNTYLQQHPEVHNDTVFAYILLVFKRLPSNKDRITYRDELFDILERYENCVDLTLAGIPPDYKNLLVVSP